MQNFEPDSAIVQTGDGSHTLFHPQVGEHYHSKHGALAESRHVFLGNGLRHMLDKKRALRVLEVGFGTGLNFILSAAFAEEQGADLEYWGVEAYPLPFEIISALGYAKFVPADLWEIFAARYADAVRVPEQNAFHPLAVPVNPGVRLAVLHSKLMDLQLPAGLVDVIYFDAFAAVHQPEMWTKEVFERLSTWIAPEGVLVTYAITGELKRTLKSLGWHIEKLPGAPGKREMLRATKIAYA